MTICETLPIVFIITFYCVYSSDAKLNVVFIMVDDLRPSIYALGDKKAYTPNIDKIIKSGSIVFENTFAQQALCAPSRNSLLTSRRPDSLHLYDFYSYWRDFSRNYTTLPQYLKSYGYYTSSIGKIFHPGRSSNYTDDFPLSWSEPTYHPPTEKYMNSPVCTNAGKGILTKNILCAIQDMVLLPRKTLPDIECAVKAKELLANITRPFFLSIGFHKPHIPFMIPSKFIKYHQNLKKFKKPNFQIQPLFIPTVAWNPYNDVRSRDDVKQLNITFPYGPMNYKFGLKMRQYYYAAVSYIDNLIGQVYNSIILNDTVLVITSDHGWSLGEHAEWAKYNNYDTTLKVPLIFKLPHLTNYNKIKKPVELIDIFPTLVDLLHLPKIPRCLQTPDKINCVEGKSLAPLIQSANPRIMQNSFVALSQYPRPGLYPSVKPDSDKPKLKEIKYMGYTIRTLKYRYTLWTRFNVNFFKSNWTTNFGEELFDHSIDLNENINLWNKPELLELKMRLKFKLISKFNFSYY